MRSISRFLVAAAGLLLPSFAAVAQQAAEPATLFENVRVFDGKGSTLSAPTNVLIRGNKIERISAEPIVVDRRADTQIIDGGGRTLMPGLIDNALARGADPGDSGAVAR